MPVIKIEEAYTLPFTVRTAPGYAVFELIIIWLERLNESVSFRVIRLDMYRIVFIVEKPSTAKDR